MKKIIPFKKEILFNTNVYEITSISLEHNLSVNSDNYISGSFYINGEYKITDASVNTETFDFDLPCDISLDDKYLLDSVKLDIDDFYYEVVDATILKINIDVLIDGLEEKEEPERIIVEQVDNIESNLVKETSIEELKNDLENESGEKMEVLENDRCIEDEDISSVKSLFGNFKDTTETYKTYKVYIVREGDNLDSIIQKYSVSRDILEKYNNLNEINLGDKIIIPSLLNEKD